MGHYLTGGSDLAGQGPKLILPLRRQQRFVTDTSALAHLTAPAQERSGPVLPNDHACRLPEEVVRGLGLDYGTQRQLELAVREWMQLPDVISFRKSLYMGLRSLAPSDFTLRNEIAKRAQEVWKASRSGNPSRVPERWDRTVIQKASQLGLFGVFDPPKPEAAAEAPAAPAQVSTAVNRPAPRSATRKPKAALPTGAEHERLMVRAASRGEGPKDPHAEALAALSPDERAYVAGEAATHEAESRKHRELAAQHPSYAVAADMHQAAADAYRKGNFLGATRSAKLALEHADKAARAVHGSLTAARDAELATAAPEWKPGDPDLEGKQLRAWQEDQARRANLDLGGGLGTAPPPGGWKPEDFPPPAKMHAMNEQARASAREQARIAEEKRVRESTPEAQQRRLDNAFLTMRHGALAPATRKKLLAELEASRATPPASEAKPSRVAIVRRDPSGAEIPVGAEASTLTGFGKPTSTIPDLGAAAKEALNRQERGGRDKPTPEQAQARRERTPEERKAASEATMARMTAAVTRAQAAKPKAEPWKAPKLAHDKPPAGFTPIPGSKHGGWHKRVGDHFEYWYPGIGVVSAAHANDVDLAHKHHAAMQAAAAAVTAAPKEEIHGEATPGPATDRGAGDRRLVVPIERRAERDPGAPRSGEGEGGGGAAPVKAVDADAIDEHAQRILSDVESGDPTLAGPPEPEVAITIAKEFLPPIKVKLPEDVAKFPYPTEQIRKLFKHQIEGSERMLQAWQERDGFILQADAGLGKTLSATAAIVAHGGKRNLIIVPTTNKDGLMKQWGGPFGTGLYGIQLKGAKELTEGPKGAQTTTVAGGLSAEDPGWYVASYDELLIPVLDANGKPVKEPGPINAKTGKPGKAVPKMMPRPELFNGTWDTIAFDECHSMVGQDGVPGPRAAAAKELADRAGKVAYMSATPYTHISDMHYLTRLGNPNSEDRADRMFGNSPEEFAAWAEYVGAIRTEGSNAVKNPSSWIPKVKLAATMHVRGMTVKHQAMLEGMFSKFHQLNRAGLSKEQLAIFDTADQIFKIGAQGLGESIMGMWKSGWTKSYWETLKIPQAIEMAKAALAEGKQVALFSSFKAFDHSQLRRVPEKLHEIAAKLEDRKGPGAGEQLRHAARDAEALVATLPPATDITTQLVSAFGGPSMVAEIHGNTTKKPSAEQAEYQAGRKLVAVCTQAKGGTGISLHDTTGERPRVQVNLSIPYSGRMFDQVAGRSHRLGSKSETTVHWLLGEDPIERRNAKMVALRLRNQKAYCTGMETDDTSAAQLAAFDNSAVSVESDDENDTMAAMEEMALDLENDEEERMLDNEKLGDIRVGFREYAAQLVGGRDLIGEAFKATKERKAHEKELAHARAAEQIRAKKNWHVEYQPRNGRPGYFIPQETVKLPDDHPAHAEMEKKDGKLVDSWGRQRSTSYQRATSTKMVGNAPGAANTKMTPLEAQPRYTQWGTWIPQEQMENVAKALEVHKHPVDMRPVMRRATEKMAAADAAAKAEAEAKAAKIAVARDRAMNLAQPETRKAIEAIEAKTSGRFHALPVLYDDGSPATDWKTKEPMWHLSADPDERGDIFTRTHKEHLKQLGAFFTERQNEGGHGWTVKESAISSLATHALGHADWKKSLTIPSEPLDAMLARIRSSIRMKEATHGLEMIWCAEAVGDELGLRSDAVPEGWRGFEGQYAGAGLAKARTHKYIKRVPTGNPARPWKYYYRLPSGEIVSSGDIQAGARFKASHLGHVGHFHVVAHDVDRGLVHVKHDESGREAHVRTGDLQRMVQGYHEKETQRKLTAVEDSKLPAPPLPRVTMGHLGKGGYDAIEGFHADEKELHRLAARMKKPDREFATIRQPTGFVLASRKKGAPDQPAAEPKPSAPPASRKTTLMMRGSGEPGAKRIQSVPVSFELVEAHDLIASHDPQTFAERAEYPKGVQERRYHEVESDRTKIDEIARNMEPGIMVNTSPTPIDGAPIVTEGGVVLGGNGRTMGMQRAYQTYPEKAAELKEYLSRHARAFGYSAEDVQKMKAPILVRRIQAGNDPKDLSALGRRMNESLTQGLDPRSAEVTIGKNYVNAELMDSLTHHMEPDQNLSDFLNSTASEGFVKALERSGVIDRFNKGEFVDQDTGLLNEDGRLRVERVLAARLIPDASLLSKMNQKARAALAASVPMIAQMETAGWDIRPSLKLAAEADVEMRREKLLKRGKEGDSRNMWLASPTLTKDATVDKVRDDPVAIALLEVLQDHAGTTKMPKGFKQVALEADRQKHDHGDVQDMFARPPVETHEAIAQAFGLKGTESTYSKLSDEAVKRAAAKRAKKGSKLAAAMPDPTWFKAAVGDAGLGRYLMHAITWEARNLVRAAVAATDGKPLDGAKLLARLKRFVQDQAGEDRDFARALGAHPINDTMLHGLLDAMAQASITSLAKSLARMSLWNGWQKAQSGGAEAEVIAWLRKNPRPEDHAVHALAARMGINKHRLEEMIYAILGRKLQQQSR